jgi:signal recognition particle subunit SRP54
LALEKLGGSLSSAIHKILRQPIVDEAAVKELVRDLQRALLQSDVNVQLVLSLSKRIEERALKEKLPQGISRRDHVVKVVYEELTKLLGESPAKIDLSPGRMQTIMLVGIQGSGKTTTAVKMARYYQKRGLKSAIVCADTYRPGAFEQLRQLAEKAGIPVYGGDGEKEPTQIASEGVEQFRTEGFDIIIIDTAGRHKNEADLIREMVIMSERIHPSQVTMVIDATIGQLAASQAKAFHEATPLGSIFVAKLDGSARGGGALSAVAATGAPIQFLGTGEKIEDIEPFVPSRFVGRLLGMGDIEGLVERVREAEIKVPEKKAREFMSGKFTLMDMYEQLEAVQKMGPLKGIIARLPGIGSKLPEDATEIAEDRLKKWRFIIQSMTKDEREDPRILQSSRIRRIARGSGCSEKEVKELVKQHQMMRKLMKSLKRRKLPFQMKFQ